MKTPTIGFIGQGFIGKNYADDFEARGFNPVRYALEPQYADNKAKITECDLVFIAVPTPTTPQGFDDSIVHGVLQLVGVGKIAVIKSTMAPGTTERLQALFPNKIIVHSPEFLAEATASHDAAHPERNIIGIPKQTSEHQKAAELILSVLPPAPFKLVCSAREAEYIKYAGNAFLFLKVVFANIIADAARTDGCNWDTVAAGLGADPRIGPSHLRVNHASGHPGAKTGRGAGGHCFIKDFAALREHYAAINPRDKKGIAVLEALEQKNIELLQQSGKDLALLAGVYGANVDQQ